MTLSGGRRQVNGGREVSEKALALEAAIRRIKGVVSARVSWGPAGEVSAINVLIGRGAGSKRIIRDVESACTAHLGRRPATDALSVARAPGGLARRQAVPDASQSANPEVPGDGPEGPEDARARHAGGASSPEDRSESDAGVGDEPEQVNAGPPAVKRYRVISRPAASAEAKRKRADSGRGQTGYSGEWDDDLGSEARIGMRQVGINVYPDRIHATVELSCAGRTFAGEYEGLPTEENRFSVPVGAVMKALDQAFGGLVGVSVDDVQLCRLSGRKTAVVLATVASPWGDVPSTGASYATRSEEEAVIRALLHAVNRCVRLTYGGEESVRA